MPTSIREQIMASVATALGNVTTGNGYNNSLASVQRYLQSGLTVADVPTAVVNFEDERREQGPTDRVSCELRISVDIFAVHDEDTVTGSTATLVDTLAADCEKSIMQDPTRGGLALTFEVESVNPFQAESGSLTGITLGLRCRYYTDLSDPFTGRN